MSLGGWATLGGAVVLIVLGALWLAVSNARGRGKAEAKTDVVEEGQERQREAEKRLDGRRRRSGGGLFNRLRRKGGGDPAA